MQDNHDAAAADGVGEGMTKKRGTTEPHLF